MQDKEIGRKIISYHSFQNITYGNSILIPLQLHEIFNDFLFLLSLYDFHTPVDSYSIKILLVL